MGAMNKLRENTGVILWILVLSFGVIWTLQDSNVFEAVNQPSQNVAVVNGQAISNQEYRQAVEQQQQRLRQRSGDEITPRMQEMIRQRAYDQLINSQLLEMEMKRLGISVTDREVEDMVFGSTPHPLVRRWFADSTGQINYAMLQNMAQNPRANPQFRQMENILREQRRQAKMTSLVQSTVLVSEEDVEEYHWRQNVSASVQYVAQRYASVPDDSVTVTESDLRDYYQENKEDFRREKTVTLNYVTLPKVPTAEDSAAVADDLEGFRDEFAAAENDSLFLAENASERAFSRSYVTPDEMDESVADAVYENPEPGRIAGPVFGNGLAHLIKIRDTQPAETAYIHARHILLESDAPSDEVRSRLAAIRDTIESGAATFGEMARTYSEDQSAEEGGDLGWFGPGTKPDRFDQAAFNAEAGALVGPVRSEFGYHLIQIEGRADEAVQIADLAFNLSPSQATLTDKQATLEDISFYAQEESSFEDEAERRDLEVEEVQAEATQSTIPGIGQSQALSSFMESAEEGDISDVIELDNIFVLAKAASVQPEGYRPFAEVQDQIRPRVTLQKKQHVLARQMRRAVDRVGFDGLPQLLNTELRTQSDVTFSTETAPGVGRDPMFAGTVFGLDEGQTSGVVQGENAAFVVRLTRLNEPAELTDAERQKIREKLLQQRRRQVSSQWMAALRDEASITDNRSARQY